MANEINIQAVLTVARTGLSLQGSATKDVDQAAGSNGAQNVQSIATTSAGTALNIGGVTFPNNRGFLFVKNTDATNYVELSVGGGTQTAFDTSLFSKLFAGEVCLIPMRTSQTYYARANISAVTLQVAAVAA